MYSKYRIENNSKQKDWRDSSTDNSTCCARETLKFLTPAPTEKPGRCGVPSTPALKRQKQKIPRANSLVRQAPGSVPDTVRVCKVERVTEEDTLLLGLRLNTHMYTCVYPHTCKYTHMHAYTKSHINCRCRLTFCL